MMQGPANVFVRVKLGQWWRLVQLEPVAQMGRLADGLPTCPSPKAKGLRYQG